jgi:hypothetical protein
MVFLNGNQKTRFGEKNSKNLPTSKNQKKHTAPKHF